jgi:hypothetical protein
MLVIGVVRVSRTCTRTQLTSSLSVYVFVQDRSKILLQAEN